MTDPGQVTRLLRAYGDGDREALDRLFPLVYEQLRTIARSRLGRSGRDVTLDKVLASLESIDNFEDNFGSPPISFAPDKHQGGNYLNFYQVQDGTWQLIEQRLPF